jgi:hypothetical protein
LKSDTSNAYSADLAQVAALPLTVGDDVVTSVLSLTSSETKCWLDDLNCPATSAILGDSDEAIIFRVSRDLPRHLDNRDLRPNLDDCKR